MKPNLNTGIPVHYVDCLSNLAASFFLMTLHMRPNVKKTFYLPE